MTLEAQYRAIYELAYKRGTRDAFNQAKFERFAGTNDAEAAEIRRIDGARLDAVVQLHANDIGNNWYAPRFPASWKALQVAMGCNQAELTKRFTDTPAFELRINDDFDGRALAAYVQALADVKVASKRRTGHPLRTSPWLPELLRYERMIAGHWPDAQSPRVETFEWDVSGVYEALMDKELFPVDELPTPMHMLLHRDDAGVSELVLNADQARVLTKLLSRTSMKDEDARLVAKCRRVLNQLRE
jgi:hypothetical protein